MVIQAGTENALSQTIELSACPVSRSGHSACSSLVTASYSRGHWYNVRMLPDGSRYPAVSASCRVQVKPLLRRRPVGKHARSEGAGLVSVWHVGAGAHTATSWPAKHAPLTWVTPVARLHQHASESAAATGSPMVIAASTPDTSQQRSTSAGPPCGRFMATLNYGDDSRS